MSSGYLDELGGIKSRQSEEDAKVGECRHLTETFL